MDFFAIYFGILLIYLHILKYSLVTTINVKGEELEPLFKTAVPHFSRHEVVVPLIYKDNKQLISTFHQGGHLDDVTVKLSAFSRNFTLDLKINRNLFSKKYVIKNYSENGTHIERPQTHKEDHCFYHGGLRGSRHSRVALSTCNGVSGYIHDGRDAYHIEPAFDIDAASHRLYRDSDSVSQQLTCGAHPQGHSTRLNETRQILHKNEILHRMRRSLRGPYDANKNTRYVELYLVNDYRTYVSNGRNIDHQIRMSQNIINIVSMLYQPFSIYVVLVGMENWQQQDMFMITNKAHTTLENFLHYRKSRINPQHPNDNAQLIAGTSFDKGVVGKAIKGTICTYQYSGGVNLNLATPGQTAATIAHELGHNFGMDHDNYTYCQCKGDKCIMAATSGGINTPTEWSSCSMFSLQEAFEMGMDYCLRNKPDDVFDGPVCGNGFTEDGEDCDCGLQGMCENKCCNASTCKLTPGSQCATGSCCDLDTCKPKAEATLCRASVGACDLPEFCWGTSQYCPDDVYLEDGMDCNAGQSYCYKGKCKSHTGQCKLLWGSTGRVSDPVCFKHLNTNGSKHGNCGYNWTTKQYKPCLRDDVMCGLLHCVHQNEKLMFWKDNLAHATPATFLTIGPDTYICRGAMLDVGLDMPDPGMVPDGAKCGDRKICVDHKCQALSQMQIPTCAAGCSDKGVCNSQGNCHCNEGFAPPLCDTGGNGGSIDSGPIKVSDSSGLLIGLLVLFLVVLPLLGLATFMTYRYRLEILAWWHARVVEHKNKRRPKRPSRPPPKPELMPPPQSVATEPPPSYREAVGIKQPATPQANRPNRPPPMNERPKTPTTSPLNRSRPTTPQANRPNVPNKNGHVAVIISSPVLTGSTHKDGRAHIQQSPHLAPKQKEPKTTLQHTEKDDSFVQKSGSAEKPQETKSLFGDIFKRPNFTRSQDTPSPKPARSEEMPMKEIVSKRELTREISNPILISTTDRRSKHLVKLENINVNVPPDSSESLAPLLPPHVSITRSESENTHRNRPLPPRPLSMPESECGDNIEVDTKEARKSMVAPRMPMRPPPPPIKPSLDRTRQTIEDAISRIDDIKTEIPSESSEKPKPAAVGTRPTPQLRSVATSKPSVHSKPVVSKSKSDSTTFAKKPMMVPKKAAATATKSEPKAKQEWTSIDKPIFSPKAKPAVSATKSGQSFAPKSGAPKSGSSAQSSTTKSSQPPPSKLGPSKTSKTSKPAFPKLGQSQLNSTKSSQSALLKDANSRKASTDSIEEDSSAGAASVSGLAKMFEGQKKPLLGAQKDKIGAQTDKKPSMPQKPGKQIRSVNV